MDSLFVVHHEVVSDSWVDYNGHMNVAYYALVFDHATDQLLNHLGIGEGYVRSKEASTFVLETHTRYLRELARGAPIRVETQLLGFDRKKLHYFHRMHYGNDGYLAATQELLSIHVDMKIRRSAPFPDNILPKLEGLRARHGAQGVPEGIGARISL